MNIKLTLTIDEAVIQKAKEFAKGQNRSLSDIIENYLKTLTKNKKANEGNEDIPEIIKSLRGSLKLADDIDYKEERLKRLEEKYLK